MLFVVPLALAHPTGMTWALDHHDNTYGVDLVSCYGGTAACDAYSGDTACSQRLPVLCFSMDGSANPGVSTASYPWAYGHVTVSRPVFGYELTSGATADAVCRAQFGPDWRAAEFHDGWGWTFQAFGHVRADTRFWVKIDDQPANCWD